MNKKEFIFEKIKKFINKYQLLYENDVQLSQIKVLYDKNKIEIYEIMIYLWVDIINDEEDEEFMNIYNNLINKINDENALNEILEENKEKKPNNYIDKMTYNLTNDKLDLDNFENNPEKIDSANTENEYNENSLSYYILNIDTDTQKEIIIKKDFLK